MDKIREMLENEIMEEFKKISSMDIASKEKNAAIDDLTKLYRLKIEESRTETDFQSKSDECKRDYQFKQEELSEQVKDRYLKLGIAAAEILLPLMFYGIWMHRGFKFEETGTYTSTTFRGLFNRFKPTKK